jgi:hypothetical protein
MLKTVEKNERCHRSEVNTPGLSLRRDSKLFRQPVRLRPPVLCRALHTAGDIHRSKPVAILQAQNSQTSIQLSLPFGTLIPRDRSARLAARSEKLTFVSGPMTLRSPNVLISLIN